MQVNVLGTTYTVTESNGHEDVRLRQCDGYCDPTIKVCVVDVMQGGDTMDKGNLTAQKMKNIRHELIHAFLFESGLAENSWAGNEEIVDWIAAQFPKLAKTFEEAGAV